MPYNIDNKIIDCYIEKEKNVIHSEIHCSYGHSHMFKIKQGGIDLNSESIKNLICYDLYNKPILLVNNRKFDTRFFKSVLFFEHLISGFENEKSIENLQFREIEFTFPYINLFFINIDSLETIDADNPYKKFAEYLPDEKKYIFKIDENFKIELYHDAKQYIDQNCFQNTEIELYKTIKIKSKKYENLDLFMKKINLFMLFVSFSLKKNVLIFDMKSKKEKNSAKANLKIEPFQYKLFDTDFTKKIPPHHALLTYDLIGKKFNSIIQNFYKNIDSEDSKFKTAIELYLRNQDISDEVNFQVGFLTYTQAIEAIINTQRYNNSKSLDQNIIDELSEFKNKFPEVPEIQNITIGSFSFVEKMFNIIKNEKIENIFDFEYSEKNKIKLLSAIKNVRNYYTHYSSSTESFKNLDLIELNLYTKILLETIILKLLGVPDSIIKKTLSENYPFLKKWNSPYMKILIPRKRTSYSKNEFLGSIDCMEAERFCSVDFYFKEIEENKIKLICKYLTTPNKTVATIIKNKNDINKIINSKTLMSECYKRYKKRKQQLSYK